jgi:hypothetical protein
MKTLVGMPISRRDIRHIGEHAVKATPRGRSSSKVYRALGHEPLVIKTGAPKNIEAEAASMQKLRYAGAIDSVDVQPFATEEGRLALPIRYAGNVTLSDLAALNRIDSGEVVAEIAYGLLSQLAAIHRAGFIHYDLHLGNVVLDVCPRRTGTLTVDETNSLSVIDFAEARAINPKGLFNPAFELRQVLFNLSTLARNLDTLFTFSEDGHDGDCAAAARYFLEFTRQDFRTTKAQSPS